jgi:hypothetical protein
MKDAVAAVLTAAASGAVEAPTAELGYERIRGLTNTSFNDAALAEAVADCVRDGLVRDPVRLEPGALQCRWRLELTLQGLDAARGPSPARYSCESRNLESCKNTHSMDARMRGPDKSAPPH